MKVSTEGMCRIRTSEDMTSSKGNQNKWNRNGDWYKADGLGYEALAEILVSRLLQKTNVGHFVNYEYELLEREGTFFHGCRSVDFMLPDDDKLVSVERLFQAFEGESATKAILKYPEMEDRIRYVAEKVEQFTGLPSFGDCLRRILTVDALFLNEDRHFHNLAVIRRQDGTYREAPVFDQGAALFSDVKGDYPLELKLEACYERIQAKPFSVDFDRQLDACEKLYGTARIRMWFTMGDVVRILQEFRGIYEERILDRVREVMRVQMRKYQYLLTDQ